MKHTLIIDDPFDDLPGMKIPNENSNNNNNINNNNIINNPKYLEDTFNIKKLFNDEEITENLLKEKLKEQESKNQALILELLDDLPDSEIKPPENILFVCKLNPITTDEDLENIFERFGHIKSCQIIRDKKTGESLQYAFIEFEKVEDCEKAYLKMNGVLVDDKRIKVDFSQSVSKFWMNSRKNNNNNKNNEGNELKLDVKLKIKENKNFNIINGIGNKDKNNNNYGMILSNGNYNYNKKNNIQYNINKQFYDNIKNKKNFQRSRSKSNHHKHNHKYK
jgi:peptidyl-prolyl cis-trans isomerase-like 4